MRVYRLIRDKLAKKPLPHGVDPFNTDYVQPYSRDHTALLLSKCYEELGEIGKDMSDPEEYADLLEALQCLADVNGVSWTTILGAQRMKRLDKGSFMHGLTMVR